MEETQELRHRVAEPEQDRSTPSPDPSQAGISTPDVESEDDNSKSRRDGNRMALAKRGLKSLAIMLAVPMTLNLAAITIFGSGKHYRNLTTPAWVPPLWPLHMVSLLSSLFMTLSAWLFWAEGGFHKRPRAFYLYAAGILMNMFWDPVVLGFGASRVGLGLCAAMVSALSGCYKHFSELNPAAGHLVKPCFGLAGVLAVVNLRLACI